MGVIVNGKKIAENIKKELLSYTSSLDLPISFDIVYVGSDPVIDNFIRYKQEFGQTLGVKVQIHNFPGDIGESQLIDAIETLNIQSDAIIIQLPLPQHLDTETIVTTVAPEKDVDVLGLDAVNAFKNQEGIFFPPVTGSIVEVFNYHEVSLVDTNIVVIGNGSLVGYPMTLWLDNQNLKYNLLVKETPRTLRDQLLKRADIIISGAGSPGLVSPDMIQDGVVLIDAGTSEAGRKIVGDIHPHCKTKARLMTPVPGGIGPITIAVLYRNIIKAHQKKYDK